MQKYFYHTDLILHAFLLTKMKFHDINEKILA